VSSVRVLSLLTAIVVVTAACDPGYGFQATNESDSTVLILFGGSSDDPDVQAYVVPPGAFGQTMLALSDSAWRGRVRVVDENCKVLWEGRIDAREGAAVVAHDGSVTWSDTALSWPSGYFDDSPSPRPAITSTAKCGSGEAV
jgi:hypothetical protein